MKVTLSRLVVADHKYESVANLPARSRGPYVHILATPEVTHCGYLLAASSITSWRPATKKDRTLAKCSQCATAEIHNQRAERAVLRAMGELGFH